MLYREYRNNFVLLNLKFTNTQLKNANTQWILFSRINTQYHKHLVSFLFFSVWLLSVLRGHSFFPSPPQRPMTSDFEEFLFQILSITFFLTILILEKEPEFPFFNVECQTRELLVPKKSFYNIFGTMQSLTGDWLGHLPHSMPALFH